MRLAPVIAIVGLAVAALAAVSTGAFSGPSILATRAPGNATPAPSAVPAAIAAKVALVEWAKDLTEPLALVAPPGDAEGSLWVAEKTGTVRVLGLDGTVAGGPVVDLSGKVSQGSEQGLLGLAFHPRFASNRLFYLNYTDLEGDTRVVEWRLGRDGKAERTRELLHVEQPWSNHNGGEVLTGPDGKLWIGLGDGGSSGDPQGNGQNPQALLGKMLRLDPGAAAPRAEIVLHGLRNPWRYSFDRKTGDLYIGDVGQNRWEEVSVLAAGTTSGNLGWDAREGFVCYEPRSGCKEEGLIPPVAVYRTGHEGCTIVGGHVYRGKALPELDGVYFYADYCTGLVRSFRWSKETGVADHWDWKPALDPKDKLANLSSFGVDADGELYVVSLGGTIRKLVRVPVDPAPRPAGSSPP